MNKFHSSQDILRALKQQRDKNPDVYITVPMEPRRTLLLMGPTRAGKSTIVHTLQDSLYEPQRSTLFSPTRKAELQEIGGLRIIDMPGFSDRQTQTRNSSLNNNSILDILRNQLNNNDPVHLFAFVFSLVNGIKQEDIDIMIYVQSNLPQLAKRTILVVTNAEELDDQEKDNLAEEFFDHPDVKKHDLRNFFKREILFVGCLRYESLNQLDYTALVREHQNVLEMRKRFIEKCFEDVPIVNNQEFIKSHLSWRSARFYVLTFFISCALLGLAHYVRNNKTNVVDPGYNPILEGEKTENTSPLVPNDPNQTPPEGTQSNNNENEKSMPASNNDSLQDADVNQSSENPKLDSGQSLSSLTTNKLLEKIIQVLETQSKDIADIKVFLHNRERKSKRNEV